LYQTAVDALGEVLGPAHPDTVTALYQLAAVLQGQGKSFEAQVMLEQVGDQVQGQCSPSGCEV
jgi:hypothetical protein